MEQMQQRRRTDAGALSWDDDALLAAIQARDDAALATFYDRYGRPAFGLAYRMLGERGAAEDVVQEAFLNVWRRAGGYELGRGSARANPASTARSAQFTRGRVTWRRSTATSWRSMRSSMSLAAELRASSASHPITWQNSR